MSSQSHEGRRQATAELSWLLQDARARTVRALEALIDGDLELAEHVLDDLSEDLRDALESVARA